MQVLISTDDAKWIAKYKLATTLHRTSTEYDYSTVVVIELDDAKVTHGTSPTGKAIVRYDLQAAYATLPRDHSNRFQLAPGSRVVTDAMRAMHAAHGRMAV